MKSRLRKKYRKAMGNGLLALKGELLQISIDEHMKQLYMLEDERQKKEEELINTRLTMMTHVEFEKHFAEQAERFGVAKIIRQRGEDYAFQSFMLALSGIVARDEPKPVDDEGRAIVNTDL